MISLPLMLILAFSGEPGDTGSVQGGILITAYGSGDLREGLSAMEADSLMAYPAAKWSGEMFQLEAAGSVDFTADSAGDAFQPVSAGCFFTWPGSPWLSAGVFRSLREPFLQGISRPAAEWGSHDVSDLNGVSMEAGGILGFDGFWNQYGDSLSWYGVRSPWLGFGQASWDRLEADSSESDLFSGFADLRYLQPWFIFQDGPEGFAGEVQLRGWEPVDAMPLRVEVIPGAAWSEDSTTVSLQGLLYGRTRAFSGSLSILADVDSLDSSSLRGGFYMLSEAGIEWELNGELNRMEDYRGSLSGFYSASPAGCGASLQMVDDSLSVTAVGTYSPVIPVSSMLSVTADLDGGSPDPRCELMVSGGFERGMANMSITWDREETELKLGVSAWID